VDRNGVLNRGLHDLVLGVRGDGNRAVALAGHLPTVDVLASHLVAPFGRWIQLPLMRDASQHPVA